MKNLLFVIIILLLSFSCASIKEQSLKENSLLVVKIFSHGLLSATYQFDIEIKNLNSDKIYKSNVINDYNIISDLTPGDYELLHVILHFATLDIIFLGNGLKFQIQSDEILYLGDFDIEFKPGKDIRYFEYTENDSNSSIVKLKELLIESKVNYNLNNLRKEDGILKLLFESRY